MELTRDHILQLIKNHGSIRALGRSGVMGVTESSIRRRLRALTREDYEVENPPKPLNIDLDPALLVRDRTLRFYEKQQTKKASEWHTVRLKSNAPIGLGIIGDLHLDNDGTDIGAAFNDASLFDGTRPGLYAGFIGDIWDNWVGRLERLWSETSLNAQQSRIIVKHYLDSINLLFAILGNHDLWNGKEDILNYMMKESVDRVSRHGQKVRLVFPNGREFRIMARHTFPGRSQWITQFGALKTAQLDGSCHLYVSGHTHVSGYSHGWHEGSQTMWHALQVASYKSIDEYAEAEDFPKKDMYRCPVVLIDPEASSSLNFARFEFDPHEGAERLAWMRSRA